MHRFCSCYLAEALKLDPQVLLRRRDCNPSETLHQIPKATGTRLWSTPYPQTIRPSSMMQNSRDPQGLYLGCLTSGSHLKEEGFCGKRRTNINIALKPKAMQGNVPRKPLGALAMTGSRSWFSTVFADILSLFASCCVPRFGWLGWFIVAGLRISGLLG